MSLVLAFSTLTPLASALTASAVTSPFDAEVSCQNEKAVLKLTSRQALLPDVAQNEQNWNAWVQYTTPYGSKTQTLTYEDTDTYTIPVNATEIAGGTTSARFWGGYTTKETIWFWGVPVGQYDKLHTYDKTLTATYAATNCDATAPIATVAYSTTAPTKNSVVATIETNEPVQGIAGWTTVTTKKLQKTYTANTNEVVSVKDLAGNATPTTVLITWIDTAAPVVENMVQAFEVHNGVEGRYAVTLTFNEAIDTTELKQGWYEVAGSNKTKFTKIYYTPKEYTANFQDLVGNSLAYTFTLNPVVNNSPVVAFVSPTPAENAYIKGSITPSVKATDDYGIGSYYIRMWKDAFESGTANLAVNSCWSAPGAFLIGVDKDVNCPVIDTTTLNDGKYVLSAQFQDGHSAWGQALRTIYVDNTKPSFAIKPESIGTGNTFSNVSFKLNDNGSGIDKVTINGVVKDLDNNAWSDVNGVAPGVFGATEGENTLVVYDVAGNTTTYEFTIDTIAPESPEHQFPASDALINYNDFWFDWSDVDGAVRYELQNSQSAATNPDGSFAAVQWTGDYNKVQPVASKARSVGASGTWYWQVRAIDAAGNKSSWTSPWAVTIDTDAPSAVTLSSPGDNSVVKGASVTQAWNASSSSDVDYYIYESYNDAAATSLRWRENFTGTSKTATNVANATYWWRVTAVDKAGNKSTPSPLWKVTIDNNDPVVTLSDYTANGNVITPAITATDASDLTYAWTGSYPGVALSATNVLTPDFTVTTDGTYSYTLTVTDAAGNKKEQVFTFTYATPVVTPLAQPAAALVQTNNAPTGPFTNVALTPVADDTEDAPAVQGASTEGDNTDKPEILGTTATPESKDVDLKVLGLNWYWWLPILAAGGGMAWWLFALMRRNSED